MIRLFVTFAKIKIMSVQIKHYTFDKTSKTIVFTDYTQIKRENIILITNITAGKTIFDNSDSAKTGTVMGNVLLLKYDTSSMSNTDTLIIQYSTDPLKASEEKQIENIALLQLLKRLVKLTESTGVVDSYGRQRIAVENTANVQLNNYSIGGSSANSPTASAPTLTGTVYYQPTWSGPIDPRWTNMQNARISYNTGIRSKLLNT